MIIRSSPGIGSPTGYLAKTRDLFWTILRLEQEGDEAKCVCVRACVKKLRDVDIG